MIAHDFSQTNGVRPLDNFRIIAQRGGSDRCQTIWKIFGPSSFKSCSTLKQDCSDCDCFQDFHFKRSPSEASEAMARHRYRAEDFVGRLMSVAVPISQFR
jgi:hypothetical protein